MIYIVNGAPGCGKTSFENLCADMIQYHAVDIYSTIDFVKDVARFCGWDGKKTPENRKFLSDLKQLLTEWDNVPYKKTIVHIETVIERFAENGYRDKDFAIFIDCREPEEITKLKTALCAKTVCVRREVCEQVEASNKSDRDVLDYQYDILINNNGTFEDLKAEVEDFLVSEGLPLKKTPEH